MRLFINYARVDQKHCDRVAEMLRIHELWFDRQVYPGQDWWKEITRRIDWCEGMVYLMSPDSVASVHCRREYQMARRAGKGIFPVLIRQDTAIPDDLAKLQYVDFSQGIRPESVQRLLSGIHLAEKAIRSRQGTSRLSSVQSVKQVADGLQALQMGEFGRAVNLLRGALAGGFESQFIDLRQTLQNAETAYKQQKERAQRDYMLIVELIQREETRMLACRLFSAYRTQFPDYDPAKIAAVYDRVMAERRILPAVAGTVVFTPVANSPEEPVQRPRSAPTGD